MSTAPNAVPYVTLDNGVRMPQLGLGVWQVPDDETAAAVTAALEAGYRSIDTAAAYGNEAGVGRALGTSGIPRDELFVTTKLWNSKATDWIGTKGQDAVRRAFDTSLRNLGLETLDLYLIHWPFPKRDTFPNIWKAFEQLYTEGRVRAIGVSNFRVEDLQRLFDETGIVPAVNQIELHPHLPQHELRAFHAKHGITTEAWSPLAKGGELLKDPTVVDLADVYKRTPAQIVLRWHLQNGTVVIPKSVTPSRIAENIDVFGFHLEPQDMAVVSELATGHRTGPDPSTFDL